MSYELTLTKIIFSFLALINILITVYLTFFFNKKLKKFTSRFSFYNELQLKSLSVLYSLMAEFKEKSQLLEKMEKQENSPDTYKKRALAWVNIYIECKQEFSRQKYIYPKKIRKMYGSILIDFNSLSNIIDIKGKLESLFYINNLGEKELGGDFAELEKLSDEIKKYNTDSLYKKTINTINQLLEQIEAEFDKIS